MDNHSAVAGSQHLYSEEKIVFLCVLLDQYLNHDCLQNLNVIFAGMPSVSNAPAILPARLALHNLRQMQLGFETKLGVKRAIDRYIKYHKGKGTEGPYEISPKTGIFARTRTFPGATFDRALHVLSSPRHPEELNIPYADTSKEFRAQFSYGESAKVFPIRPIDQTLPISGKHDLTQRPAGPIQIPVIDLHRLAEIMDACDRKTPTRRAGNWSDRIHKAAVDKCTAEGLKQVEFIELTGTKHLIGVPGVGKTSLLMLIAMWLSERAYKTMLIFPTIEVSRQYMEDLRFYGARVGMLVGQSQKTRDKHAGRLAEMIAAENGQSGFAGEKPGTDIMAGNCMLPAYAIGNTQSWQYGEAPCGLIKQFKEDSNRDRKALCPLFSVCGRNKGVRELVAADIWVGHVKSLDTSMSAYVADKNMRYFEFIARSFDVVVFDEADAVQKGMDEESAMNLTVAGEDSSLVSSTLTEFTRKLTGSRNDLLQDENVLLFVRANNDLTELTIRFLTTIQRMRMDTDRTVLNEFKGQFLTPQKIIYEMMRPYQKGAKKRLSKSQLQRHQDRFQAASTVWEHVATGAFNKFSGYGSGAWAALADLAKPLGTSVSTLEKTCHFLIDQLEFFLRSQFESDRDNALYAVTEGFAKLCFGKKEIAPRIHGATRILIIVSFLAIAYRRLVRSISSLPSELGESEGLERTSSKRLSRLAPESLLGSVTGLRYNISKSIQDPGVSRTSVQYSAIKGLPRMRMLHFDRLYQAESGQVGPVVLMMSATSFLKPSPSYHISEGPHYVLRRNHPRVVRGRSFWSFSPVRNHRAVLGSAHQHLFFSGAGDARNDNLREMVAHFVRGGMENSELYKAIKTFNVEHGIRRKAAFVVNSYEQAELIKQEIDKLDPQIGRRTKAIIRRPALGSLPEGRLTSAQVEASGDDDQCDILIFPIAAIGRGVNIVFTKGPRIGDAAIGTFYFLTRPHPSGDDLTLLLGLAARAGEKFANHTFDTDDTLDDIRDRFAKTRQELFRHVSPLLHDPLMASRLPDELFRAFTANQMVDILQTIGRGTRKDCAVQVFFVDAAWAPNSANGKIDQKRDSMLIQMLDILHECIEHPDAAHREIYTILYGDFYESLKDIRNVHFPAEFSDVVDDTPDGAHAVYFNPPYVDDDDE